MTTHSNITSLHRVFTMSRLQNHTAGIVIIKMLFFIFTDKLVIKIWTHTRDSWTRSLNARKNSKMNGVFVRPYKYHKEMLFLKKVKNKRIVEESDNTEDEEQQEEEEVLGEIELDSAAACENEWNVDSKDDIDLITINQDNTTNEIDETEKLQDNNTSVDNNMLNAEIQAYLNNQMKQFLIRKPSDAYDDRNFAFFKSVHPTLTLLDDDQILEFQSGVINLLRNIKSGGRLNNVANNQPSSSRGCYNPPEAPGVSQVPVVGPRVIHISSSSTGAGRTQPRIERDPLKPE